MLPLLQHPHEANNAPRGTFDLYKKPMSDRFAEHQYRCKVASRRSFALSAHSLKVFSPKGSRQFIAYGHRILYHGTSSFGRFLFVSMSFSSCVIQSISLYHRIITSLSINHCPYRYCLIYLAAKITFEI